MLYCNVEKTWTARRFTMDQEIYTPDSPYLTDNLKDHPEELSLLLSISKPKDYTTGGLIYVQGEESKPFFYLIEQGKVKISLLSKDGSEKIIIIQEKNTLFGYASTFDGHPYFHTATAVEKTRLRIIHINDFLHLVEKHPKVSLLIIVAFARVTRMLVLQIEDFSFLDAEKRVAHMIYKLAYEVGQKTSEGLLIEEKVTREDIASLTGLSKVSVSLALNHFEDFGILKTKRNTIEVLNIEKLKTFAGDLSFRTRVA
jgi:CRP/FNR family transcriptional regulator, cyclic AMP receptor protein